MMTCEVLLTTHVTAHEDHLTTEVTTRDDILTALLDDIDDLRDNTDDQL
jgi:hypothetical protein